MNIESRDLGGYVYWVEGGGNSFLYAPFKQLAAFDWRAALIKRVIGYIPNNLEIPAIPPLPVTATLDCTHSCPLECRYCSVVAGRDPKIMDFTVAETAVDIIIANGKQTGYQPTLVFGAGGEPLMAWQLLKRIVNYARAKAKATGMELKVVMTTCGAVPAERISWAVQNIDDIVLSFDGPAEIQNAQRPFANGRPSFETVDATARQLFQLNATFSIRATITRNNINIAQLVKFFSQYQPRFINVQPLSKCGRCLTGDCYDSLAVTPEEFVAQFITAQRTSDIPLVFPGVDIGRITPVSCHAYNNTGMVVTNWGLLSACERVLSADDPLAGQFIYGQVVDGTIQTKTNQINTVDEIPLCHNCFMRWHCQGQCHHDRLAETGDRLGKYAHGCQIVRQIGWHLLYNRRKRKEV